MKNFHLPLQEEIYSRLRSEAERAQVPDTELARAGIGASSIGPILYLDPARNKPGDVP